MILSSMMILQNGCLLTDKALSLSHVSSNINMLLEIWTNWRVMDLRWKKRGRIMSFIAL